MSKIYKGLFFLSLIFLFFSYAVGVDAASAYFVWEKYIIDVPVNSNLEEYKDDYVLKLYVNGELSDDFYVEYETNTSTFSTVSTHKVGKYTVYYKAYSKNNYISSEQAIIFNVCDITAPTIKLDSNVIEVEYGYTLHDFPWNSISDDTCKLEEINVVLNDKNVIYNTPGTYPAVITATDKYGNKTKLNFFVKIVNKKIPTIKVLKQLYFEYGIIPDYNEYFLCLDSFDNNITKYIEVTGLDTYTLGKQEVNVKVKDAYNNVCEINLDVFVIDTLSPQLILECEELILDVSLFDTFNTDFFKGYVYRLTDNYSQNITLVIDLYNFKEEVKDYEIVFIAMDENKNITKKTLKVMLREMVGPVIEVSDYIEVEVGSELDLHSLVTVFDPYDENVLERLIIESENLDLNTPGEYTVTYTSFNTSGIYTKKTLVIKVLSNNVVENIDNVDTFPVELIILISVVVIVLSVGAFVIVYKVKKSKKSS